MDSNTSRVLRSTTWQVHCALKSCFFICYPRVLECLEETNNSNDDSPITPVYHIWSRERTKYETRYYNVVSRLDRFRMQQMRTEREFGSSVRLSNQIKDI